MTVRPDTQQAAPATGAGGGGAKLAELARFFAVAVAGLAVDLAIGWTLAEPLGLPLAVAATAGFAVAAALNYALHELWTFRDGARQLSAARALRYLGVLGLTLAVRLAALAVLARLFPPEGWTLAVLGLAAAVSFAANYAASRMMVFRRVPGAGGQ